MDVSAQDRFFPRRLTSEEGIFNSRLVFKNNRLLVSLLFSKNFCGEARP